MYDHSLVMLCDFLKLRITLLLKEGTPVEGPMVY
jgi:hypothetical protein